MKNFNGEEWSESYEVVSSLFIAYISKALRHFLIFHERFYGTPNFLWLLNEAHTLLFPVLAPIINSAITLS